MKRLALLALLILALTGCAQPQLQDIETGFEPANANEDLTPTFGNPDAIHSLRNMDLHPTLAIVCFEGVAIVTTSQEVAPLRVEAYDSLCPPPTGSIEEQPNSNLEMDGSQDSGR